MSAFQVNDITIHRILSSLSLLIVRESYLLERMEEMTGVKITSDNWQDILGRKMYMLNLMALHDRYNSEVIIPPYKYKYTPVSDIQALKSLQCFLYQCNEGTLIPHTSIYKFFADELKDRLMSIIIYSIKEYDTAEWA